MTTPNPVHPAKLQVAYGSDFFLDDRRLRTSLGLLYDKVYLPTVPTFGGCQMYGSGVVEPRLVDTVVAQIDGVLAQEGVIERLDLASTDQHGEEELFPADVRLMARDQTHPLSCSLRKMLQRLNAIGNTTGAWQPNSVFASVALANFYNNLWTQSRVQTLFIDDTVVAEPPNPNVLATLVHEELLTYFLPDIGGLNDDEIMQVRSETAPERIAYRMHILELVDSWNGLRHSATMRELRSEISDKVQAKIIPSFVEYTRCLRARRTVNWADRAVAAISVDGSIFEPRYWFGALRQLLRTEAEISSAQPPTNRQGFMSYLARLSDRLRDG